MEIQTYRSLDQRNRERLKKDLEDATERKRELELTQRCIDENQEVWPYVVEYNWEFKIGDQLFEGDLVLSDLYRTIVIIEVKWINMDKTGHTTRVRRTTKRKDVLDQLERSKAGFVSKPAHEALLARPRMNVRQAWYDGTLHFVNDEPTPRENPSRKSSTSARPADVSGRTDEPSYSHSLPARKDASSIKATYDDDDFLGTLGKLALAAGAAYGVYKLWNACNEPTRPAPPSPPLSLLRKNAGSSAPTSESTSRAQLSAQNEVYSPPLRTTVRAAPAPNPLFHPSLNSTTARRNGSILPLNSSSSLPSDSHSTATHTQSQSSLLAAVRTSAQAATPEPHKPSPETDAVKMEPARSPLCTSREVKVLPASPVSKPSVPSVEHPSESVQSSSSHAVSSSSQCTAKQPNALATSLQYSKSSIARVASANITPTTSLSSANMSTTVTAQRELEPFSMLSWVPILVFALVVQGLLRQVILE